MSWFKFLTVESFDSFEKRYCYNAMKWISKNATQSDGFLKNVKSGEKTDPSVITLENFDPAEFPAFGHKNNILNTHDGFTTGAHACKLSTDGFYYARKMEDRCTKGVMGEDGEYILPPINIPMGTDFYNGCVSDGEVFVEPEWPAEDASPDT